MMDSYNTFISYSHEDAKLVLDILSILRLNGCKFWYDKHLSVTSEYTQEIAERIAACSIFLAFFSADYKTSKYCNNEWDYAERQGCKIVMIRLDNTPLSKGMDMKAGRFQHLSYVNTEAFYKELLGIDGICGTNDPFLQLSTNRNKYTPFIRHLANWLISLPHHWSTYDIGTTAQNANTCEGLLAMKCIGYDLEKKTIYRKVFERITGSVTERGLISKSLQAETVVCTSMLLLLAALENSGNHNTKTEVFSRMAEHLWSQRNEDAGWGVYCERTEEQFCCTVNTCWALIALSQYPSVADTDAYKMLCRQMFELDSDGLFGFYIGGKPKLIATAMSLCLLHILAEPVRAEILEKFEYEKAVDFVFDRFTRKGIQVEQEELYGIDKDGHGAKKVPWNHITCAAALTVLAQAYKAGVLSESRWETLLQHIDLLLQNDTVSPVGGKQFYVPDGIDSPRVGVFTFPTAYLLWGLQKVQGAIDYKLELMEE